LFFSWSVSVMPGFRQVPDAVFLQGMQAMNKAIQNPLFLSCFMGAPLLLAVCCKQQYGQSGIILLLASIAVYIAGVLLVTFLINIPLNDQLDKLNIQEQSAANLAAFRARFEGRWNLYNNIRTFSSILSFALLMLYLIPITKRT